MDEHNTAQTSLRQTHGQVAITPPPRAQAHVLEHSTHVRNMTTESSWQRAMSQLSGNPSRQAFVLLRGIFTIAPLVAGLDKFVHGLVDWDKYVARAINDLIGGHAHVLMLSAGVVEIAAGIGVALWPRVFAYVVSAWLLGIVANLLLSGAYYDIALRDLGLAAGALALGRLCEVHARARSAPWHRWRRSTHTEVTP